MPADQLIKVLTISSLFLYVVAAIVYWVAHKKAGFWLYVSAWLVNVWIVLLNWQHSAQNLAEDATQGSEGFFLDLLSWLGSQAPLGNMHHILVFFPACLLPCFAFLHYREKLTWLMPYIGIASSLPLVGALMRGDPDLLWKRMPALQSPWFVPHIVAYMIAYALATVAFILLCQKLIHLSAKWTVDGVLEHESGVKAKDKIKGMLSCCQLGKTFWLFLKRLLEPVSTRWDQAAYRILLLAFPFFNFGLWSGALWAEEAWGKYWSWDNKETWALITWMLYLVYFHCRRSTTFRKWTNTAHFFAFIALVTTLFLVNLWPKLASALHSYTS